MTNNTSKTNTSNNSSLTTTAWVELQGDSALNFIQWEAWIDQDKHDPNSPVWDADDQAVFDIIGFAKRPIRLIDKRSSCNTALKEALLTRDFAAWQAEFNTPAEILLTLDSARHPQTVVLCKTGETDPARRLWIAIGIEPTLPVYDYIIRYLKPFGADHYALIALYNRSSSVINAIGSQA